MSEESALTGGPRVEGTPDLDTVQKVVTKYEFLPRLEAGMGREKITIGDYCNITVESDHVLIRGKGGRRLKIADITLIETVLFEQLGRTHYLSHKAVAAGHIKVEDYVIRVVPRGTRLND